MTGTTPPARKSPGQRLHEARQAGGARRPRPWPVEDWEDRHEELRALDEAMAEAAAAPERERAERAEAELEHAKAALAGDHEGIRLWMLDCGELVTKHRARVEAAEAKLAEVRDACRSIPTPIAERILAIIGSEEEARDA